MSYAKVEDQSIIDQLNKKSSEKVIDPEILRQLNHEQPQESGFHPFRDIVIGLSNLGHSTLNAPSDISQTFEQRGKEFGEGLRQFGPKIGTKDKLSQYIPRQEEYNYAEALGQKGEPETLDWLMQKGTEHLPDILGATALYRNLPIALTRRGASRELRQAQNLARERNVGNLNIPNEIMQDIPQFLPQTAPYRQLLEEAAQGGYEPLFATQSDLGQAARGYGMHPFFAERRFGREAGRLRNRLLDAMQSELENQGHLDIADLLRRGQQRYRNYNSLKGVRNTALTLGAIKTPYGKRLLRALHIID